MPALQKATEDEDWPVRAQTANALGMIGDLSTIPTLQKLTVGKEWWVRLNASRALANIGPAGERALTAEILEGDDHFARERAAATLEERGIVRRAVDELEAPGEGGRGRGHDQRDGQGRRSQIPGAPREALARRGRRAWPSAKTMAEAHELSDLMVFVNYFVLAYFLAINGVYLSLYVISFVEIADYVRRETFSGFSELFGSNYAPPVSVIVPAYNEEATIASSVRSFLTLHYPLHQVVVVNDGSKDRTLDVLIEEFDLHESDQPVRMSSTPAPALRLHGAPRAPRRRRQGERREVRRPQRGRLRRKLPAGLLHGRRHNPRRRRAAQGRAAHDRIRILVAVGGIVRVANGCEFEKGRIVKVKTPDDPTRLQIVEYLRAFIASRTAWSKLNCLMIISGAFGMFRRRDLISAGGYASDTVGEDMELVTRITGSCWRTIGSTGSPSSPTPSRGPRSPTPSGCSAASATAGTGAS